MKAVIDKLYYDMKERVGLLMKAENRKPFWYEVWIDFGEDFDEIIYPKIKDLQPDAAARYCLDYMERRERFYGSPYYYAMLDKMVADVKFEAA